ncbi:primase-helicase zinc-binding domain-containing protein [Aeromonas veronii]|uniref:Primase-helicase zinc-binding domain-containing protein n=1 Tax=Aeromonas allosaccharophila TaxID=656 RepID=A0ABZ0FA10_9GAMM|nr:primase-helicase zinc-binding domain-containing protein [Aeromonas allosaccharophila]WOE66229.1 primase-helicase zinc-binding domain-containing protein [Aeromonas allosaccharophila]
MMNHNINAAAVTAAAQGQWRDVLTANGINLPSGRHHGACPICMAGKDRFRFDDKEGRGTWVCNQCGAGDGLSLYQQATGQGMSEVIRSLASYLGLSGSMSAADHARIEKQRQKAAKAAERQAAEEARQRDAAAALAQQMEREAVLCMAEQVPYLARKGLSGFGVEVLAHDYGHHKAGALLVVLFNIEGVTTSAEIIDSEGRKMALAGGQKKGSAAYIEPLGDSLPENAAHCGVVEGYATGLSVRALTGWPVFCGMSKAGLMDAAKIARYNCPKAQIVVCGDIGAEKEAREAAATVGGITSFPPSGGDWDDYRQAQEVAA